MPKQGEARLKKRGEREAALDLKSLAKWMTEGEEEGLKGAEIMRTRRGRYGGENAQDSTSDSTNPPCLHRIE